jgi:hypothetical protein
MSKSLSLPRVCFDFRRIFFVLVFLFLILGNSKDVFAAPGTDSMLGYWKFDGNATDFSGDGCTGLLGGGTVPNYSSNVPTTTFANANSINFSGSNSYVTFANQSNLQPNSALTFSTWIYLNAFPSGSTKIAGNFSTSSSGGFYFVIDSSTISFYIGTASPVSFPITALPVANWKLLTATWDGTTVKLFLNGVNMGSTPFSGTISYSGTTFQLGNVVSGSFNGKLDDVRLYSRALFPSAEISDLAAGKHLTSSWVGATYDYETAVNWSPQAVPDPYTYINIDIFNATINPRLPTDESVAGLLINPNSSLDIGNHNFTINDSGAFTNNGTFILGNYPTQTLTGFVNDTDSGTIQITGYSSTTGLKTDGSSAIGQYYNLTMASTGVLTLNKDLVINHNLGLEAGTLNASTYGINVKGNWINGTGTSTAFVPSSGTVSFSGINQSIIGSNTFYNLSKITSTAETLSFQADSKQTVLHNLTLLGAGSISQFLSLRSSTPGTQWKIDPQGTKDISGVDVQDSNNMNSSPVALLGRNKNSGNNSNWTFDTTAPSLVLDPVNSPTSHRRQIVTGIATETNVTVSLVSFRLDATTGAWTDCIAKDAAFDSSSEIFSCKPETDLPDGQHTVYVRAQDSNDTSTVDNDYASISFRVDTKPPDVSSVSDDSSSNSAKITWKTNENASSRVEYGKSSDYGKVSSQNENVKDHGITLKDLSSCTEYHYRAKSTDAAGNDGKSTDRTFKTTGCPSSSSSTSSSSSDTNSSASSASAAETSSAQANTQTATADTTNTQSTNATSSAAKSNFNGTTDDDWQVKYFGSAYCQAESKCGGAADPDGDGLSNDEEFRLGTNPLRSDSDNDGLADSTEIESGHDPIKSASSEGSDTVVYESPKEGGIVAKEKYEVKNIEVVESDGNKKLKISGKGPPNTYVTVYVYSDPIVLTIKTDNDGNWSYVLDQDVEDGQHEVYVAVTDNTGKVAEKSEPLAFIKTAEAVTIIPPAEAAAAERAESPTEAWYKGGIFLFISIVFAGLMLALGSIGIYKHRTSRQSETISSKQNP